jgi:hypothetical protein
MGSCTGSTNMMLGRNSRLLIALLLFVSFCPPRRVCAERQDDEKEFLSEYKVIVERNIFSRNRGYVQRTSQAKVTSQPSPESYFVLKGVVHEHDVFVAFLEDTRSGSIIRAKTDDTIARGTIKNLTLDYIEFELNATASKIKIGYNLEGKAASPALTYNNLIQWSQVATQASASSAPIDANEPQQQDNEVLKRLMERRKQELGK